MSPEVPLIIESSTIVAKARKLKAVWSREAQEDLRAVHNIAAESDLADILAQEIQNEIDAEILNDLANNVAKVKEDEQQVIRKKKKKLLIPRSITDDWEVSRFD